MSRFSQFNARMKAFHAERRAAFGTPFLLADDGQLYSAVARTGEGLEAQRILREAGHNPLDPDALILDYLEASCPIDFDSRVVYPAGGDARTERYKVSKFYTTHGEIDGVTEQLRRAAVLVKDQEG